MIALSRAADGGRLEHPPRRGTRFAPGDQAYLLGPYEELLRVLRHQHEGDVGSRVSRPVTACGRGRVESAPGPGVHRKST